MEKFIPKKTTDDCYTPPEIYEAVRDWVCNRYGITADQIVRPFWPGEDYKSYEYPENSVVLDNPPFSILSRICEYYLDRGIRFFLFAPSLTAFSGIHIWDKINHLICDCNIIYENGAVVRTSFITNLDKDMIAQTCPELSRIVNEVSRTLKEKEVKQLPAYEYPDHVITAAIMQRWARYGVPFSLRRGDCVRVTQLDAQKSERKSIFGGGLLLSERAAAKRAAAERAATERAATERVRIKKESPIQYQLSERERAIVEQLGRKE